MDRKVLLGMSGGIDSSVAAMLLKDQGFEVIGITFLFSGNDLDYRCGSTKSLAEKIGIEHHVVDLREDFENLIIQYFIGEYSAGRTPFPCAVCNPELKFHNLEKHRLMFSCDYIATGHYVQIIENKGIKWISKGADRNKDQSFFLWGIEAETIKRLIFPLGVLHKSEVREIARQKGFEGLNRKSESLGVCFIDCKNYRGFLQKRGLKSDPGNFIDSNGAIIGKHKGIFHYTIGQRRGLGLNLNKPMFVSEIRAATNEVILMEFDELYRTKIQLKNTCFVDKNNLEFDAQYIVKTRYRLQENLCKIKLLEKDRAEVELKEPLAMVANGQTAVFYDGNRVIGGGFIEGSA